MVGTLLSTSFNRGMSLEAIAAMLGHRSLDMTLRYAKIASRTVADEYFAVTGKVEASTAGARLLPADAIGPKMARLRREHHRLLGNGYCTRPPGWTARSSRSAKPARFFQTSIQFRPFLQAQHDDAMTKHQDHRRQLFASAAHPHRPGRWSTPGLVETRFSPDALVWGARSCLPRYRRLAEPRSDHFSAFVLSNICPAALSRCPPDMAGLCPARHRRGWGISSSGTRCAPRVPRAGQG